MSEDDAWWKFALIYLVWLLAAVAIALAVALFIGQIATFVGVGPQSLLRRRIVEVVTVAGFVALAAVPFVVPRLTKNDEEQSP